MIVLETEVTSLKDENYDYASPGLVVASIKRRDIIPLQPGNIRWINGNNLNYRRTKDIRKDIIDRRFEISEAQLREAQRLSEINEIREDEIKSAQRREEQIRNSMQLRENSVGNRRENQLEFNYNNRNSKYGENKDQLDKLHREMRWLTIDADDGFGIGIQ
ncbi:unnamed protein product [Parnassius apollo]|uniref:(apollo) hypothetical protein n=1 Tax=Parnassius apollo TaxID=110799 RepID=A0A8S3XWT4_PARAO|nr:unnamed protein product [Parnassius apollo]